MDKHLTKLAQLHMETRFIKVLFKTLSVLIKRQINAEKAPFLAERLDVVVLPTIICTENNFASDKLTGFEELGKRDDFTTATLAKRLAVKGSISMDKVEAWIREEQGETQKAKSIHTVGGNKSGQAIYSAERIQQLDNEDSDPDFWTNDKDTTNEH